MKATLRLAFEDEAEARRMADSIEPENDGYLETRVEGSFLVCDAEADSPLSLLRTLDDALACIAAAEKAGRVARE